MKKPLERNNLNNEIFDIFLSKLIVTFYPNFSRNADVVEW